MTTTGKLLPRSRSAAPGRPVDALGKPVDGKGPIDSTESYPVEKIAPASSSASRFCSSLHRNHGDRLHDPHQRELIIGDRGTGKTTITIDTIINQAKINKVGIASGDKNFRPVYSIYVAVGQKNSNIVRTDPRRSRPPARSSSRSSSRPLRPTIRQPVPGAVLRRRDGGVVHGKRGDAPIVYDDLSSTRSPTARSR